jgi:hypothetical protein
MNAVEVVMMARTAGIELTIDGDSLQLSAASEPPLSVIEELRRHKLEIVNLLRSNDQRFEEPPHSEPYGEIIAKLRSRCPDHIERDRWQQAIQDGDSFVARWGAQAQALGWTAHELFGLHTVPARPAPNYSRLSRYDETGLIWLLNGRPVVAMTEATAAIRCSSGNVTTYRKRNKPALGPLGDSLDDMANGERLSAASGNRNQFDRA